MLGWKSTRENVNGQIWITLTGTIRHWNVWPNRAEDSFEQIWGKQMQWVIRGIIFLIL